MKLYGDWQLFSVFVLVFALTVGALAQDPGSLQFVIYVVAAAIWSVLCSTVKMWGAWE